MTKAREEAAQTSVTHTIRHPFDNTLYALTESGEILVTDGDRQAYFHEDGRFIRGDFRHADPQMCVWVGNRPDVEPDSAVQRRHTIDPH